MKTKIKDILTKKGSGVFTVEEGKTVHDAVKLMNQNKVGALLAVDKKGKLVGIITERDILHEFDAHIDSCRNPKVEEIMTKNLIIGVPTDEVRYLLGIMTKNKIRHLPIMDGKKIEGIISIGDLVKSQLEDFEFQNRYLMEYMEKG